MTKEITPTAYFFVNKETHYIQNIDPNEPLKYINNYNDLGKLSVMKLTLFKDKHKVGQKVCSPLFFWQIKWLAWWSA